MDKKEILGRIELMRTAFAYSAVGGPYIGDKVLRREPVPDLALDAYGAGDILRADDSYYVMDIRKYFQDANPNRIDSRFMVSLFEGWAKLFILEIGNWVKHSELPKDDPLFEFLRHIRNAVAHNERFNITGPLAAPANFEHFEITQDLHGLPLWDMLQIGDLFALADVVEKRIQELS